MADISDKATDREAELLSDALLEQRLRAAKNKAAQSLPECAECGDDIPTQRQKAVPGVRLCVACQARTEHFDAFKNTGLRLFMKPRKKAKTS
jgi:phage/conjugal plasmid C-4 type zinc finger TraR family protein